MIMLHDDYIGLDREAKDGTFTVPSMYSLNMGALRIYCKDNNIRYEDLMDNEIDMFKTNDQVAL
jgi:hypothetical protein